MNMKQELQRDFLRLQKILRELRFLRYNYLSEREKKEKIEEAIRLLGPLSDELKEKLDKMEGPRSDYDL